MTRPDITRDFELYVDNLTYATLTIANSAQAGQTFQITTAHRNQVSAREYAPSNGNVRRSDTIWQFPITQANVATPIIPLGSTLTLHPSVSSSGVNDAEVWTILSCSKQIWSSKWEVLCRNLAMEANLNTQADIIRATYSSNYDGERIPSWALVSANVRANFQPVTSESKAEKDRDHSDLLYDITLESAPSFTPGVDYRIVDPSGLVYGILEASNLNRIDELPVIRARLIQGYSSSGIA
jgi:hypothetical protein